MKIGDETFRTFPLARGIENLIYGEKSETDEEVALWRALAVNLSPIGMHLHNGYQTTDQNMSDLRDAVISNLRKNGFDIVRTRKD